MHQFKENKLKNRYVDVPVNPSCSQKPWPSLPVKSCSIKLSANTINGE